MPVRSRSSSGRSEASKVTDRPSRTTPARVRSCSSLKFADDLLDQVFQGDDAGRSAVLVGDDGHLEALLAQQHQEGVHPHGLGNA